MRAIVQSRYGPPCDVLSLDELPTPTPGEGEVRIRVHASSINKGDFFAVAGTPFPVRLAFGLRRPKHPTPGRDVAGIVDDVGPGVTRLAPGDAVVGELEHRAWAEFACAPASSLAIKPSAVSFEDAATLPVAAITALQGLRDHGKLQPGETVLVNGASGNVGPFAVQVAKALGAHVTAVCSTRNVETAASIGADHVIDYTTTDLADQDARFDVVFDIAASRSIATFERLLTPTGRYVVCGGQLGRIARVGLTSTVKRQVLGPWVAQSHASDLDTLLAWIADGRVDPVIERTIGLEDVPEALRDQGEGHGRAKTVVRI